MVLRRQGIIEICGNPPSTSHLPWQVFEPMPSNKRQNWVSGLADTIAHVLALPNDMYRPHLTAKFKFKSLLMTQDDRQAGCTWAAHKDFQKPCCACFLFGPRAHVSSLMLGLGVPTMLYLLPDVCFLDVEVPTSFFTGTMGTGDERHFT